jgi:hypothetical protein
MRVGILIVAIAVAGLSACGSAQTRYSSHRRAQVSVAWCTNTWTGKGGDAEWNDALNWSAAHVPDQGDGACIRPGSLVIVNIEPTVQATTLVAEGTLCVRVPLFDAAASVVLGVPVGTRPLEPLTRASLTSEPTCPRDTTTAIQSAPDPVLAGNGSTLQPSPPSDR